MDPSALQYLGYVLDFKEGQLLPPGALVTLRYVVTLVLISVLSHSFLDEHARCQCCALGGVLQSTFRHVGVCSGEYQGCTAVGGSGGCVAGLSTRQ
jgi:hypothetical protein